nr:hypothetical protein [Paguma larvata torque teno virus]
MDNGGTGLLDTILPRRETCGSEENWNRALERYKLHEAIWKQSCSRTHSLFCNCGDWTSHIKLCGTGTGPGDGDSGGVAGIAGIIDDDPGLEFTDVVDG